MQRNREEDNDLDEDYEALELEERVSRGGGGSRRKKGRSKFSDDHAEEYEDDDGRGGKGASNKRKKPSASIFLDQEALQVDDEDEEEEEEGEDDFIVYSGTDLPGERVHRGYHDRRFLSREEDDIEDLERRIQKRFSRHHEEYDEEATDVEQLALLPSVRDPKLCKGIGREREVAVCLMQKFIDRGADFQIRSVVALEHLKNYIYVEADKETHVKEAIKGMRNIYANQKILLVPIREMTDVVSVESNSFDLSRGTWVRMKMGTYKGDLAKVVDFDNVLQRLKVKLIPRIDLQALASKLVGRGATKKKAFVPPSRFFNIDEARELHIRVQRWRDPMTGDYFENIDGMHFKDGFLFKTVSLKSITAKNVTPSFVELEKFNKPSENGESEFFGLSTLSANRKKGHFMKGDAVIVVKGDLKNLKGWVEKVDEENVLIRTGMKGLPDPLAVNKRELCKCFEPGNHVKVVSGTHEGATGMVVKVDQHVLIILSAMTKEHLHVFADHVVESSEVTTGGDSISRFDNSKAPAPVTSSPRRFEHGGMAGGRHRGGRRGGDESLLGTTVKIRLGPFKGYRGPVVEVKGNSVRVELEMKIVTVDRDAISVATTPFRDTSRLSMGSESPMHPSLTPLHPCMTPMRDSGCLFPSSCTAYDPVSIRF